MRVVIVGAGAAGLMAAGALARAGCRVTVLEHMAEPAKKILVTGKGRCNLTNNCDNEEFLRNVRTNPRFLYSCLRAFDTADAMAFFEELGVPLKTERGRRVFPVSDKAAEVRYALLRWAGGAQLVHAEARQLLLEDGRCAGVRADAGDFAADGVLIATGGLSYPATGSTGDGYKLAAQAGHAIVDPVPSLVSLVEAGGVCRRMTGLSLRNVELSLREDGKEIFRERGEMLFTHFGISGPLTLSASAHIGDMRAHQYEASIDLKPALDEAALYKRITGDFARLANKDAVNALDLLLPAKMRPVACERWGVPADRKANQITREEKQALVRLLKDWRVPIRSRGDLEHAVITSGGVDVRQVNPRTMESRLCPGLYFAGEVLDVDAYTGGYNLQIAWSTARAAARALAEQAGA